ncbi:uncharacterized protein PGTG_21873 [Puccinia graminis f. sp. tritici CRL 75-36-700-3]|uniref:Uncharacterized protein n=1 Tax=Puccinia graminis f. sp. tritici (strain CRL 75-36-700-3 / race SCCL) TaxID=418459 RepID=H6QSU1_PUCGT|nr:uncharacterized protein PGTG_21873 [Puccinia graminis f. sp. tritici CRL 75-36-700-3]EHS63834.1 hypothetical protein PGTG_21873 [Puccinia graminis f. sp. tritici CRL 75-36-700-3]
MAEMSELVLSPHLKRARESCLMDECCNRQPLLLLLLVTTTTIIIWQQPASISKNSNDRASNLTPLEE